VKKSWKDKKGEAPIYLRITINGERAEISTNSKINPELWDKASQRVAGKTESAKIINLSLNNLVGKVEKYYSNLDVKDEKYNKTDVRLCDLNNIFIESYDTYLKSIRGLNHNSAAKNLKNLCSVKNQVILTCGSAIIFSQAKSNHHTSTPSWIATSAHFCS